MSDELQAREKAFLRESDELDVQGEGDFQGTVAESKGEVIAMLAALGATRLLAEYDGSGDQGFIDSVCCRGPGEARLELPENVREAVEEFIFESLPDGWEIDEGSFGTVEVNVVTGKVVFGHAQRLIDVSESWWEG